jgi:Tol biopolymer transport system component
LTAFSGNNSKAIITRPDYNLFMRRLTVLTLCLTVALFACTPKPPAPLKTSLLTYRFEQAVFAEYSETLQPVAEIVFFVPPDCGLSNTYSPPVGIFLVIELTCPNGPTVLFLNTEDESIFQPVRNADSHFLAWTSDGKAAYLKVDSLGSPKIIRAYADGAENPLAVPEFTYDLAAKPDSHNFIYAFSLGLGKGSELHYAQNDGRTTTLLYSDPQNYISFARYSPDGKQIAFLKTPDTKTPFTVGELWMMNADGSDPRKLADADAGHGYAANWSPDGKRIAFVVRENSDDEEANQSSEALISNIYLVDVASGVLTQLTHFTEGHVETPFWSPDGNTLAFNMVIDGRMIVSTADVESAEVKPLETESACCPAWMRK